MKAFLYFSFLVLLTLYDVIDGAHFRGGIISWRPLNPKPFGTTAKILIHQRYFWNRGWGYFEPTNFVCTEADVAAQTPINVNPNDNLTCLQNCPSSTYPSPGLSVSTKTTDCQQLIESLAGETYVKLTLPLTTSITIGYQSNQWMSNLAEGGNGDWSIVNRLNLGLRPDGYINSSPVTNTLPVIFYLINTPIVHIVQMADNDPSDILRCRWSNANSASNYNQEDECKGICYGPPLSYTLTESNCTLSFILTSAITYYPVALQIEDFYDSTYTTPMSSVPIQFLFRGYIPSSSCTAPSIIGVRPNRACIGVPINITFSETIIVETHCPGQTIVDFITASPYGMTHSPITQISTSKWTMILTWTPEALQAVPQTFCAAALDNSNLQSAPWCVTYLVNYTAPDLVQPKYVQHSASPVGTVFQNESRFTIEAKGPVGRPTRNGTNIYFKEADTNATVLKYDAGYASNIIYTGNVIVIITNYTWTPGKFYYVTMDSGFSSGQEFCHAESESISDPSYWRFNIWDPAVSSTTTTTTTPFTTVTVTTKPTSTTSINTLLTTTGIVITTTTPVTTTVTPTTSASSTTTTTGSTALVSVSDTIGAINPQDIERLCQQPILIMNIVMMLICMPIYTLVMYAGFTKFSNMFNPVYINAKRRHDIQMKRILQY
ncbi:hypothetical protein I4U23_027351 [Adineta vaga]|nr:hypothetical protein I4U23_027351 [Adineta vaga]